jgi:hypothetical protein
VASLSPSTMQWDRPVTAEPAVPLAGAGVAQLQLGQQGQLAGHCSEQWAQAVAQLAAAVGVLVQEQESGLPTTAQRVCAAAVKCGDSWAGSAVLLASLRVAELLSPDAGQSAMMLLRSFKLQVARMLVGLSCLELVALACRARSVTHSCHAVSWGLELCKCA